MPSITCRHGGQQHTHHSVLEVKQCQGVVATTIDVAQARIDDIAQDRAFKKRYDQELALTKTEGYAAGFVDDAYWHSEIQRREREEDEAVARFKAARDYTPVTRYSEQDEAAATRINAKSGPKANKPGIYVKDGQYYKVQAARESGRLYAKRGYPPLLTEKGVTGKWRWAYDKGAIYNVKASHLLTAEQASEFGKINEVCVSCFAPLTHEESMDRGYGPTCADNHGWPYDHHRKG